MPLDPFFTLHTRGNCDHLKHRAEISTFFPMGYFAHWKRVFGENVWECQVTCFNVRNQPA